METFDSSKLLPQNIIIRSAETHLYRIGLCLTSKSQTKRSRFHNPLLVFIVNIIVLLRISISLLLPEDNSHKFIVFGDFAYFIGLRYYFNSSYVLCILLVLSSQLIYYYNYKNDIKPNYLKVFEMMSGLISPKSIGLTNKQQIYRLMKITKILFFSCKVITEKVIPISIFCSQMIIFLVNCSTIDAMVFGVPNGLLYSWMCYYVFSIILWQITYFYVICHYIKIRIKEFHHKFSSKISRIRIIYSCIDGNLCSLNSIFVEINEYNDDFWSKYLLSNWLLLGSIIIINLCGILFVKMDLFFKTASIYMLMILILIFVVIMKSASSVNYEANKIYNFLNHMIAFQSHNRLESNLRLCLGKKISSRLRVSYNLKFN